MHNFDPIIFRDKLKTAELNCIRRRLEERGVSQRWIAQKLNKTNNTVNGWCCNKVQPHLIDLILLSILLQCSVKELIEDIEPDLLIDLADPKQ